MTGEYEGFIIRYTIEGWFFHKPGESGRPATSHADAIEQIRKLTGKHQPPRGPNDQSAVPLPQYRIGRDLFQRRMNSARLAAADKYGIEDPWKTEFEFEWVNGEIVATPKGAKRA